ncbi:MAG: hypothetical protein CL911_01465 [Deltaproteobacteria bacterium]|nr:hypothetical protein [Deltaproteobacteria bacterium]
MKKEDDFSEGERGKFYTPDAVFNLPVYLEEDNLSFVEKVAKHTNSDRSKVVNDLIRTDRQIAEIIK